MKKPFIVLIVAALSIVALACSCTPARHSETGPTQPAETAPADPVSSGTPCPSPSPTEAETEEPTAAPSPETNKPSDAPTSFIGALSDEEKNAILAFASDWYAENFYDYEVLSMDFADDDDPLYEYYSQYRPGELIILKVETTHGGRGVYRGCFIAISEEGYNVVNEGY